MIHVHHNRIIGEAFIQKSQLNTRESYAVIENCNVYFSSENPDNYEFGQTPVGSVEFIESILENIGIDIPTPDFYPNFAPRGRVITTDLALAKSWPAFFAKNSEKYKKLDVRIFQKGESIPEEYQNNCVYSEVVAFAAEARYYIIGGTVICSGFYDGPDDYPCPPLDFEVPESYNGALDIGWIKGADFGPNTQVIVESHHPYACGHYAANHKDYALFLRDGFDSLIKGFR